MTRRWPGACQAAARRWPGLFPEAARRWPGLFPEAARRWPGLFPEAARRWPGLCLAAALALPLAACGSDEAIPETGPVVTADGTVVTAEMVARFHAWRMTEAFVAVLFQTAIANDRTIPPACDSRQPIGRQLVAVSQPVIFPDDDASDPVAGRWQERFLFEGCGERATRNVFVFAAPDGLSTIAGLPGDTRANLPLQRQVGDAVLAATPLEDDDCGERHVVDTTLVSDPGDPGGAGEAGGPWREMWSVLACERLLVHEVSFGAGPVTGTRFTIVDRTAG